MAHEITSTDGLVLHRERAWHGLGTIVQDAPTPTEALELAGLNWRVDQLPLLACAADGSRHAVDSHVLNVRSDTSEQLGVVGAGYEPIHNADLAAFAEALAQEGDVVRVESAGSIRGGRKVWFLLKGESFSVRDQDEVAPYLCISNGHDGTAAMRCTPTTVRVVCSNTLHMVIPQKETRRSLQTAAFAIRHSGDVKEKVDEARRALGLYQKALDGTRQVVDTLAGASVSRAQVQAFWLEVYQQLQGPVPAAPRTDTERRQRERATEAVAAMAQRFDRERDLAGATAWNALNAFTGWAQHERYVRGRTDGARHEARTHHALFGVTAEAATSALGKALELVA